MALARLALAAALAFATSLLIYPILTPRRRSRLGVFCVLTSAVLLSPYVVPARATFLRFLAAVFSIACATKLADLHVGASRGHRPSFPDLVRFFLNVPFGLVLRKLPSEPRPPRRKDAARLLPGAALLAAGVFLARAVFRADWSGAPFLVEHAAKVLALCAALLPAAPAGASAWRLLVGPAREMMDCPWGARTPAEFWRRYNRPVYQFLHEDLYRPISRRWGKPAALFAVFALSAVIHEYIFALPTGRLWRNQLLFFGVQGLAVGMTARLRPKGALAALGVAATWAFNLVTSAAFFADLDRVVPFYQNPPPGWLLPPRAATMTAEALTQGRADHMLDDWFPHIKLPITLEQFDSLPTNPAYEYEYFDDNAWLSPSPKARQALLALTPAGAPGAAGARSAVGLRPLDDHDWPALPDLFAVAFRRVQPFASLAAGRRREAAAACLEHTRAGGYGPLIAPASAVAFDRVSGGPVGAALVTRMTDLYRREVEELRRLAGLDSPGGPTAELPHLTWIFVNPRLARHGVGTALLARATDALLALGHRELASTFLLGNESSTLWHWQNGFVLLPDYDSRRRREVGET